MLNKTLWRLGMKNYKWLEGELFFSGRLQYLSHMNVITSSRSQVHKRDLEHCLNYLHNPFAIKTKMILKWILSVLSNVTVKNNGLPPFEWIEDSFNHYNGFLDHKCMLNNCALRFLIVYENMVLLEFQITFILILKLLMIWEQMYCKIYFNP